MFLWYLCIQFGDEMVPFLVEYCNISEIIFRGGGGGGGGGRYHLRFKCNLLSQPWLAFSLNSVV